MKFRVVLMDVFFWFMFGVGVYFLYVTWGSRDFWPILWLSGYAPLLGGVIADILSGMWHDNWEDYTIGMSMVVGWLMGPLMWLYGLGLYWNARDYVSERDDDGYWFVLFVVSGGNGLVYYGVARFLGLNHVWGVVCGFIGVVIGIWLVWDVYKQEPKSL